eukprot:2096642-Lingulodinium_polyedra.AAC.1
MVKIRIPCSPRNIYRQSQMQFRPPPPIQADLFRVGGLVSVVAAGGAPTEKAETAMRPALESKASSP